MKEHLHKILPLVYGQYFNLYTLFAPRSAADHVFHVFCKVRKGKVLPQQAAYLDKAKYQVERIAGHQVQSYRWPGRKATVLLVHGWESNTFRWRNLIKKLKEADFNIIAFDAPAHGYSSGEYLYVPLYEEVLHHIVKKYNPKYLVGHSVGGMTVMYNEFKNPNPNVEKIITVGAPSEFHEIMMHFQSTLRFNNQVMRALDQYTWARFGLRIREFSVAKFAQSNTKKGLLFHDILDPITPYHASVQIHTHWKGSTLISTKGLGHSLHQEEVNHQIITFLDT